MKKLFKLPPKRVTTKHAQSGFTLIELMIVIAIIALLVKIAMPAYTASVQRSHRTDAKSALLDLAAREEKFYSINNQYSSTATDLYGTGAAYPLNVNTSGTAYYQIQAPSITGGTTASVASFTATATPYGTQTADICDTFQIDNYGNQTNLQGTSSTAPPTTGCW